MKLDNINKPTSAFWSKVALASTTIAGFIGGYGHFTDNSVIVYISLALGSIGVAIPIFNSDGSIQ